MIKNKNIILKLFYEPKIIILYFPYNIKMNKLYIL